MYICVTHVDAVTKIPCIEAPMCHGPSFPDVKGLEIIWWNETEWPTNKPLFYGTCDDDADTDIPGVLRTMSEEQYLSLRQTEDDLQVMRVRSHRDMLLRAEIDTVNPIRWELMAAEEKEALRVYRQALLDVPQQDGFPWNVQWPVKS